MSPKRITLVVLAALGAADSLRPASGQEMMAGWEGAGSEGYAFAKGVVGVPFGPRHGLVILATGSYLWYQYFDSLGTVRVTSPGAAAALGYRWSMGPATATLAGGYERRRVLERPAVGAASRTFAGAAVAEGELEVAFGPLTVLSVLANYQGADRYLWARTGLQRQVTNTRSRGPFAVGIGVEGTVQGNSDARAYQMGTALAANFLRLDATFELRAGYSLLRYADGERETRPYFGALLYREF